MADFLSQNLTVVPVPKNQEIAPAQAQWDCAVSKLGENGEPAGDLTEAITVGTVFHMSCGGDAVPIAKKNLSLEVKEEYQYHVRVLEVRDLSETRAELLATSWVPGEGELSNLILTDGTSRISLNGIQLKVDTVIDQKANPEMKPAPPWAPVILGWPWYVWAVVAALLAMAVVSLILAIQSTRRKRKLLKLLKDHPITLSPFNHFNKELRRLSRTLPNQSAAWTLENSKIYFSELNDAFRWFLARELVIPALGNKPGVVLRDFKKSDKALHKEVRRELYLALTELQKAIDAKRTPSLEDASQISDLTRKLSDRIANREKLRKGKMAQ